MGQYGVDMIGIWRYGKLLKYQDITRPKYVNKINIHITNYSLTQTY